MQKFIQKRKIAQSSIPVQWSSPVNSDSPLGYTVRVCAYVCVHCIYVYNKTAYFGYKGGCGTHGCICIGALKRRLVK